MESQRVGHELAIEQQETSQNLPSNWSVFVCIYIYTYTHIYTSVSTSVSTTQNIFLV